MTITGTSRIGDKVKAIRELRGFKQKHVADKLGMDQASVSRLEQSDTLDDELLAQVAAALEVSPDTIRNFNMDPSVHNVQNNYDSSSPNCNQQINHNPVFNDLEKVTELYERLLKAEQEKVALLEKLLQEKEK